VGFLWAKAVVQLTGQCILFTVACIPFTDWTKIAMSKLDELGRQRARLLEQLAGVTEKLEPLAVAEVGRGVPKLQVAKRAAVTRPTLDAWLRSAVDREREARSTVAHGTVEQ
jgi:hypothetical protein